jgi:type I restriction enzyme R subunit
MVSVFIRQGIVNDGLVCVERQSGMYVRAIPLGVPVHRWPLPFCYETTGAVAQFSNLVEPDARSRPLFTFHPPEELLRLVDLDRLSKPQLSRPL